MAGPVELVVMVNGLWGWQRDWTQMKAHLDARNDGSSLICISAANTGPQTYAGIDVCGQRLAKEIQGLVLDHPSLSTLSLIGHSMGGLIARYALGLLADPQAGTIAGLKPGWYVSIASPHLGCSSSHPEEVHWQDRPWMRWLAAAVSAGQLGGHEHLAISHHNAISQHDSHISHQNAITSGQNTSLVAAAAAAAAGASSSAASATTTSADMATPAAANCCQDQQQQQQACANGNIISSDGSSSGSSSKRPNADRKSSRMWPWVPCRSVVQLLGCDAWQGPPATEQQATLYNSCSCCQHTSKNCNASSCRTRSSSSSSSKSTEHANEHASKRSCSCSCCHQQHPQHGHNQERNRGVHSSDSTCGSSNSSRSTGPTCLRPGLASSGSSSDHCHVAVGATTQQHPIIDGAAAASTAAAALGAHQTAAADPKTSAQDSKQPQWSISEFCCCPNRCWHITQIQPHQHQQTGSSNFIINNCNGSSSSSSSSRRCPSDYMEGCVQHDAASAAHLPAPLLDILVQDVLLTCCCCGASIPCYFLSGLRLFQHRATYSSAGGDHLIPWSSSSLLHPSQLPVKAAAAAAAAAAATAAATPPAAATTAAAASHVQPPLELPVLRWWATRPTIVEQQMEPLQLAGQQPCRQGDGAAIVDTETPSAAAASGVGRGGELTSRLARLESLSWRRFHVVWPKLCLGSSHCNIQYNGPLNFVGRAVVEHVCELLMEGRRSGSARASATAAG